MVGMAEHRSIELFKSGMYCAESVLKVVAEANVIESDLIPAIATGFCSGIARTGGLCGAVSGGILGLGLITGRNSPGESVEKNYTQVQELIKKFEEKFGDTNC
ncbi:MAG: C_GCAxxG_C_C family protein [Chloroflexi bacterium]|nr:C_GCAxxG_C_C family protein [Chloroflexota bacterium]